ncbi:MAG: hypothetical protein FWG31_07860 [Oscillospiraceae bacterium]|nr:hypothetical protein [Oscillospiraceae bacterium]
MGQILTFVKDVFDALIEMAVQVGTTVIANPILLIGILITIAGAGIGIFKRLIRM